MNKPSKKHLIQIDEAPAVHYLTTLRGHNDQRGYFIVRIPLPTVERALGLSFLLKHDSMVDEMCIDIMQIEVFCVDMPSFADFDEALTHPSSAYMTEAIRKFQASVRNEQTTWQFVGVHEARMFPEANIQWSVDTCYIEKNGLGIEGWPPGEATVCSESTVAWRHLADYQSGCALVECSRRHKLCVEQMREGGVLYQLVKVGGPVRKLEYLMSMENPTRTLWSTDRENGPVMLFNSNIGECFVNESDAYHALSNIQLERLSFTLTNIEKLKEAELAKMQAPVVG